jgi:hypothetical protein
MIFRTDKTAEQFEIAPETAQQALFFVVGRVKEEDVFLLSVLPGYFTMPLSTRPLTPTESKRVERMCGDLLSNLKAPILRALVHTQDIARIRLLRECGWYQDGLWRKFREEPDGTYSDALLFSFTNDHQALNEPAAKEDDNGTLRHGRRTEAEAEAENRAGIEPAERRTPDPSRPLLIDALAGPIAGGPDLWPV